MGSHQRSTGADPRGASSAHEAAISVHSVTAAYRPPRRLDPNDDVGTFVCRSSEQTTWLRHHARQSASTGTTRVFVVTAQDEVRVVAFYAWCMAQLDVQAAPTRLLKGAGRYPQPVALLARLDIDTHTRATASEPDSSSTRSHASSPSAGTLAAAVSSSTPRTTTPARSISTSYPSSKPAPPTRATSSCA